MKKKPSRLTKNLIEMGKDLRNVGLVDEESYNKITMRLLKKEKKVKEVTLINSEEIRAKKDVKFNQSHNIYYL